MITEEKESSRLAGEGVRSGGFLIMEVRSRCQVRACGGRQRCQVLLSDCASHLNTSRSQILRGLGCLKRAVHTAAQTCKIPRKRAHGAPKEPHHMRRARMRPGDRDDNQIHTLSLHAHGFWSHLCTNDVAGSHLSLRLLDFLLPESEKASRAHPRPEAAGQQSRGAPACTPDRPAQPCGDEV